MISDCRRRRPLIAMIMTIGLCVLATTNTARAADPPAPTSLSVPGSIEAYEQTDLYAKTSGYVSAVNADIGQHVKAGEVLAILDDPELEMALAESKATRSAKQRLLQAAEATTRQTKMALEVARHQLQRYKADAEFQDVTLKRQQELFEGKAITDQQLDEVRNKAAIAREDVGVAEAKVGATEADVAVAAANRDVAEALVEVAAAQVNRAQTLLTYLRIIAPYDGLVTRRMVNRGDLAQAATTNRAGALFTVQRVDTVRVFCEVPESNAASIAVGTPVVIKVYGPGGSTIDGKVTRLAGSLNPDTRTRRVEIDLPNPGERLLPGAYAQVTLTPQPAAATDKADAP
jgi:multidrug efflux pump subunit AcrA (membrane-fusion protein)